MARADDETEEYCLLGCNAVYSGRSHKNFRGINLVHLQGRRVCQASKFSIIHLLYMNLKINISFLKTVLNYHRYTYSVDGMITFAVFGTYLLHGIVLKVVFT